MVENRTDLGENLKKVGFCRTHRIRFFQLCLLLALTEGSSLQTGLWLFTWAISISHSQLIQYWENIYFFALSFLDCFAFDVLFIIFDPKKMDDKLEWMDTINFWILITRLLILKGWSPKKKNKIKNFSFSSYSSHIFVELHTNFVSVQF